MEKAFQHLVGVAVSQLTVPKCYRATFYITDKLIIKASRVRFHKKIRATDAFHAVVSVGKPNWAERKFIKLCKKAGEKFPIKKVQLKFVK